MSEKRIQVKPRYPGPPKRNFGKEIDEVKKLVKNVKQQIWQLTEHEKSIENMINKEITLELINGSERKGILKYYGKYNIEILEDNRTRIYMKHAVLSYKLK